MVQLRATGWLGRILGPIVGILKDSRPPILADEFLELQALYQVEAEETEARRQEREAEVKRLRGEA